MMDASFSTVQPSKLPGSPEKQVLLPLYVTHFYTFVIRDLDWI